VAPHTGVNAVVITLAAVGGAIALVVGPRLFLEAQVQSQEDEEVYKYTWSRWVTPQRQLYSVTRLYRSLSDMRALSLFA
jgi:hypothetical protein